MSGQQTPISKARKFSEISPDLEENTSKTLLLLRLGVIHLLRSFFWGEWGV